MENWFSEGKGLNLSAFGARPAKITNEMLESYQELGRKELVALIAAFKKDNIPYGQQDVAFNIIDKVASENPSLLTRDVLENIFSYFPSSYLPKTITLYAKNSPEALKENFDLFISKANNGTITDTKDLITLINHHIGEDFFRDEEVVDKFTGCFRTSTMKAMISEFSEDVFDIYMEKCLEEIKPDSVVHLLSGTTTKNNVKLVKYLPKLMEKCDIRDRKTFFEIALIAENTSSEDLEQCIKSLRREDLTNVIYEVLNKEVHLETVFLLGYSPDDLTEYQNTLADRINLSVKGKLIKALEHLDEEIFADTDVKEIKLLEDKHYSADFLKFRQTVESYLTNNDCYFINEDQRLIEYNYKNIVQILAGDDKALKHKQLTNIIGHEELIKTQIGEKKIEIEDRPLFVKDYEYLYGDSRPESAFRETSFSKAEKLLSALEDDIVNDFYASIGIDNTEFEANEHLAKKDIRYGVEIEEIGVANTEFMSENDYVTDGFKTTSECSLRPYRKDYESSIPMGFNACGSEFVSDVMSASSTEDLERIKTQIDVLRSERATTNYSCGMHIHVSSPDTAIEKNHIAQRMTQEFKYVQEAVLDNFEVYPSRLSSHCKKIDSIEPNLFDRFRTVNMCSLERHGSIEFRFFNMPDALDMKVLESYIDFATCYYSYVEDDRIFKSSCLDFIKENSDWLGDAPETLRSQAIFSKLCEDIEVKESTKKVLGRLPEIFDFYTAVEPEHTERYEARNISIADELKGITYDESVFEEVAQLEYYYPQDYFVTNSVNSMFQDALYEISDQTSELNDEELLVEILLDEEIENYEEEETEVDENYLIPDEETEDILE